MSDATPTYRGYRLQALYILYRLLSETNDNVLFRPEGVEDLDILNASGVMLEAIQVKSYDSLRLSNLGSDKKQEPFFKRAISLLHSDEKINIQVVNFGEIGPELKRAWQHRFDLMYADRNNVAKKLAEKHSLTDEDVSIVFDKVKLVSVDEDTVYNAVIGLIRDTVAGIDANSAFDLFIQWIYQLSEQRKSVTNVEIITRLNTIGKTLTDRTNFVAEWHTSIQPIVARQSELTDSLDKLRTEFFAGVSARYVHIEADLDFRRDNKLTTLAEGFEKHNVVIVHGASGQGKTTLAYRYLHDYYPASWRYEIVRIDSPTHALRIASALNAQATALETPIIVYVDVRPNDTDWAELIEQLTRHPYINILVTVREEDFRRTSLPRYRLEYEAISLQFNQAEAQIIYDRAIEAKADVQGQFLTFTTSWEAFNEAGPLLEYVYLLTQNVSLEDRLQEQLTNIISEVEGKNVTDKWDVLRWIAVASAYEARVVYAKLRAMVAKPMLIGKLIQQLEKEYLIRRSEDGQFVEGLHPIRSKILVNLMVQYDPVIWQETAKELLSALVESDLQSFILNTLVDRPSSDQAIFLSYLIQYQASTWEGNAGIFRTLLWAGVRDYIEANRSLIDQVQNDVSGGWCQIVLDVDLANVLEETFPFDKVLFKRITPEKRQKIEAYRSSQTPKADTFDYARQWLTWLNQAPETPTTHSDWIGLAEIMGWAGYLKTTQHIDSWLTDEQLANLVIAYDLQLVGEVSTSLHQYDPTRYKTWINKHQNTLDSRLADEYQILAIERDETGEADGQSRIRIHFIPSPIQSRLGFDSSFFGADQDKDKLHTATITRLKLIRYLYPTYKRYASQGYGFRLGKSLPLPFNPTYKDGEIKAITLNWLTRINKFARGIGEYPYRPKNWSEYAASLLETRRKVVDNLYDLQKGLVHYLGSSKEVNIIKKYLNTSNWDNTKKLLSEIPKLPQTAVDKWGFSSDSTRSSFQTPTEALGVLGITPNDSDGLLKSRYIPNGIAYQQYAPFLQAQQEYLGNLKNFFEQSLHVLVINSAVKKYHRNDPRQQTMRQRVEKSGCRADYDHISTANYHSAMLNLEEYQHQFRQLLGQLVDEDELSALERKERDLIPNTWNYWYFFANHPHQAYANARRKVLQKVETEQMALDRRIDQALNEINSIEIDDWKAVRLKTDLQWKTQSAYWITIDVTQATDYYRAVETLVEDFRNIFGSRDVRLLSDYLLRQYYPYFVIIPKVRGKLVSPICFAPHFATLLYDGKSPLEDPLALAPTQLTPEQLKALGVDLWIGGDFAFATQLGDSFSVLRIVSSQLGEFTDLPEAAITNAGFKELQRYLDSQVEILEKHLQHYLDARTTLLDRMNSLSEAECEEHPALIDCIKILIEINNIVMPQDDGEWRLSLPEVREYAENLDAIGLAGEELRLRWVADILDS